MYILLANLAAVLLVYNWRFTELKSAKELSKLCLLKGSEQAYHPFISIILPFQAHEKEHAIKTLNSAMASKYQSFEIILIYSSDDPLDAMKIQREFKSLIKKSKNNHSIRVRIRHIEEKVFQRSTCLNKAMDSFHTSSEQILALFPGDALAPHSLSKLSTRLQAGNYDYLQLAPLTRQASSKPLNCLDALYNSYYLTVMRSGEKAGVTLLQECAAIFNRKALESINGWVEHPASLGATGIELLKTGKKGSVELSSGISSLRSQSFIQFKKHQRKRRGANLYLLGNLSLLDFAKLGKKKSGALLLQLSAWHDFTLIPALYFLVLGLELAIGKSFLPMLEHTWASAIAASSLLVTFYLRLSLIHQKHEKVQTLSTSAKMYVTHLALGVGLPLPLYKMFRHREDPSESPLEALGFYSKFGIHYIAYGALLFFTVALSGLLFHERESVAAISPLLGALLSFIGMYVIVSECRSQGV